MSLAAGYASFEKEKVTLILQALEQSESQTLTMNQLSSSINVGAQFLVNPLKFLADSKYVLVENCSKQDSSVPYKVTLTDLGKAFYEGIQF